MKSKASQEVKLNHRLRQNPEITKNSGEKKILWEGVWELEYVSIKTGVVYDRLLL